MNHHELALYSLIVLIAYSAIFEMVLLTY